MAWRLRTLPRALAAWPRPFEWPDHVRFAYSVPKRRLTAVGKTARPAALQEFDRLSERQQPRSTIGLFASKRFGVRLLNVSAGAFWMYCFHSSVPLILSSFWSNSDQFGGVAPRLGYSRIASAIATLS
jgi:hypothetical protein